MGPHRKRLRLSDDGEAVAAVAADGSHEPAVNGTAEAHHDAIKHHRTLFVRGLGTTVTTDDLTEHFSQSYPIKHAVAVLDKETKQCKGYGFVTFADAEDAERAKADLNNSDLQGRKINVDIAEPRHRDPEAGVRVPAKAAADAKANREQKQQLESQSKLIIRNLPWSIKNEEQLSILFRSYGKVKTAVVPKKSNGMLAGYGFVTLRGRKNAEKALKLLNGKEVDGRTLAVDWAVDKDTWQKAREQDEQEDVEAQAGEGSQHSDAQSEASGDDEDEKDASSDGEEYDGEEEGESDIEDEEPPRPRQDTTLFIRNLPFTCTDEDLEEHFQRFGAVRYARIVIDHATEKPKGTGFACFYNEEDALACLKGAPKQHFAQVPKDKSATHSVLQNEETDPTGQYTIDGRVLNITKAVDRSEANKLTAEGVVHRHERDKDKRRLYLLSEGTIASNSPLYKLLSPGEITMREASSKQRKQLIEGNPSLHMSLTRLSVRNIPRTITSKDLKQLARQAIVGFAKDVKEGKRQPISHEELGRGGSGMKEAEKGRKARGKGVVKQATIVFEGREGSKVTEKSGAGRSRGYGFIEYYTHRSALMGLRWLNGHAIDYQAMETTQKGKRYSAEDIKDRKKRLIVEFAIENAQVVQRRAERETKMREKKPKGDGDADESDSEEEKPKQGGRPGKGQKPGAKWAGKRKREQEDDGKGSAKKQAKTPAPKDEKLAKQQRIITKKRQMRRARKQGAKA